MNIDRTRRNKIKVVAGIRLSLLVACFWPMLVAAQQIVSYPRPESDSDSRASYPLALLTSCAQRSKKEFALVPSEFRAQQGRNIRELALGKGLDVLWAVTTEEREQLLLPIRIPIDRGLIGWRLLLIRNQDENLFSAISSREQLAALRAGQGHDWPDLDVLRSNNFTVSTSTNYEGLFQMLALGHIQYFPRAVTEIWPEMEKHRSMGIGVAQTLAIHYPQALYFFVNKSNTMLANALTSCLNAMTLDGTLQALIYQFYGDAIQRAQLDRRTIIEVSNPSLPANTPSLQSIYWYSPKRSS